MKHQVPILLRMLPAFLLLLVVGVIQAQQQQQPQEVAANFSEVSIKGHEFQITNPHRPNAVLKFTLFGPGLVGEPTHKFDPIWILNLTDQTEMWFDRQGTGFDDSTQYHLVWSGENASLDREVCFHYGFNGAHWYNAYEEQNHKLPMDPSVSIPKGRPFVTGTFGGYLENVFINSDGFAIQLYDLNAWFVRRDPNTKDNDPLLCMALDNSRAPYHLYDEVSHLFTMELRILAASNARVAHQRMYSSQATGSWLKKPAAIADAQVFTNPIWSTWAEYKKDINQSQVMEFADEIKKHGFPVSQVEIDDLWERHYGDFTFDPAKFPDPAKMVTDLHAMGYRVTLWMYPFVNKDSDVYTSSSRYLVKNDKGGVAQVKWWDGEGGIVDFSDNEARDWFVSRVNQVEHEFGFDSFKFDAGEVTSFDQGGGALFNDTLVQQYPNLITLRYVAACAQAGGSTMEVRVAFQNQDLPFWLRMGDKDSRWGADNGLQSLVPSALTMAIAGYSFILPDMIGGNAYGPRPSEELYVRWVQANALLPSLQFSIPPWAYSEATVNISRKFVQLHVEHAPTFLALAKQYVESGEPIIRPLWYVAPEDPKTYLVSDQFMVGADLLVAPVVEEKATERKVYLPPGTWVDQHGKELAGPGEVKVAAPLEELPYFKRKM